MSIRKSNHCAYDIHYHFVFPVKYRKALLRGEVERHLHRISHEVTERFEIDIDALGIDALGADLDHVHLLCTAHPKYSPAKIAQVYKRVTARELFLAEPQLRKELWGGHFWTAGDFISTVGQRGSWNTLVRYVTAQGKKPPSVNLHLFS